MRFLSILLFTTLPLAAGIVPQIQVRVMTFEKSGAATSLEAAAPACDAQLFAVLISDTVAGRAKVVQDQVVVVRAGQRSKVESIREFPFNAEADAEPSKWFQYPHSFNWQNLGQTIEVEATVGDAQMSGIAKRIIDMNLAPECSALLSMDPWPVPDLRGSGQMGRVLRPVFVVHKLTTQVYAWTGRTVLLSVAPGPESSLTNAAEPNFRYTFLRAGLDGEKPAPAGSKPASLNERRLHAVTIRLPRDEAAAIMLQQAGDDAALYEQLCRRVADGTAILNGYAAILCRNGQRSKVESTADFPYPYEYHDLIPGSWYHAHPGNELEVDAEVGRSVTIRGKDGKVRSHNEPSALEDGEGPGGQWGWIHESREGPEMVPYHPAAKNSSLHGAAAEWIERKFTGPLRIPPSGVLCSGLLSTSPATDKEEAPGGLTDVCFALQSPLPGKAGTDPLPHILLQALVLSVPAAEGPALAATVRSGDASAIVRPLIERFTAGEITCPAHAAAVIRRGQRSMVECVRQVQQPGKFRPSIAAPEVSLPTSWSQTACGLTLTADYLNENEGITIDGALEWDTAPVLPFGEPGAAIPDISARRCTQKIPLREVHLTKNQPLIADVRASNAREGTPEHGRWHVLILLAQ